MAPFAHRPLAVALAAALLAAAHAAGAERIAPRVVDLHVDLPWQLHFKGRPPLLREGHATLDALRAGGVLGMVLPIYLPDHVRPEGPSVDDAEQVLATIERLVHRHPLLNPPGAAAEPGKITTFLAIEGAGAFARDPAALDRFVARGVRLVGLVHARTNALAGSATDPDSEVGLTEAGRRVAERLYRLGALVDVSHLSDRGFADLVPIARAHGAPLVATHSNARAIAPHPRNLTDAQLRELARSGGVAGLNLHVPFVARGNAVGLKEVADMAEHMIRVAGIDHVAIGSDFDGGIRTPVDMEDPSSFPRLAAELRRRGLGEDDLHKLFARNALRTLAWRPGARYRPLEGERAERAGSGHPDSRSAPPPRHGRLPGRGGPP